MIKLIHWLTKERLIFNKRCQWEPYRYIDYLMADLGIVMVFLIIVSLIALIIRNM